MIVDDFDMSCASFAPDKTDAPLIVDADRMLSSRLAFNASSRLPGGARKSDKALALLRKRNFRSAVG